MTAQRFTVVAVLCFAVLMAPAVVRGQLAESLGGLTEENFDGYLGPLNTGLSGTMNAAIFRSGHVPKVGINISGSIVAMAIEYSDDDKTFIPIDPEGFTSLERTPVPTIIGSPEGGRVVGENSLSQLYPGGFDMDGFELAVPEISIGSFYGTRALIRYIVFEIGDSDIGEFSYFGLGAQHSITQWIPDVLPFDMAAGFMIQHFEIDEDLVDARTAHFNVTASRDFPLFRPYVGLGVDTIKTTAKYDDEEPDMSFDVTLERKTDPHLTLGVAGKLPWVQAFIELNAAAATGVAVGLSVGN